MRLERCTRIAKKAAALFFFVNVEASLDQKQKKSQHSQVKEKDAAEVPLENTGDTGSEYILETNFPKHPEHT